MPLRDCVATQTQSSDVSPRAAQVQSRAIAIDTHADTTQRMIFDPGFNIGARHSQKDRRDDGLGRRPHDRRRHAAAARLLRGACTTMENENIVDHIDHAVKVAGVDHVGLGSDFDGATMPLGMEDVTKLPRITDALLKKLQRAGC